MNMLDLFKEMYAELNGITPAEQRAKKGLRKRDFVLSRAVILAIRVSGTFYLFISVFNMMSFISNGFNFILFNVYAAGFPRLKIPQDLGGGRNAAEHFPLIFVKFFI